MPKDKAIISSILVCTLLNLFILRILGQGLSKEHALQRQTLQNAISQTENLIEETKSRKDQTFKQLELLRSQMNYRSDLHNQIEQESRQYKNEIEKTVEIIKRRKTELKTVQKEYINIIKNKLIHRITYNPVLGLVQNDNLESQVKRWYLIQLMEKKRRESLQQIEILQKENANSIAQLEYKTIVNDSLLKVSKYEEDCLNEDVAYYNKLADEINSRSLNLNSSLMEYKKKREELSQYISGKINSLSLTSKSKKADYSKYRMSYPMEFPTITSRFGKNMESGKSQLIIKNNGIDLQSSEPFIKSAHDAQVIQIRKMPSQNYLLITKFEDLYIVYSNLQNVLLKEGEKISLGTHLGKATKNEEGRYELHFETWHDKVPVNPQIFIK